MAAGHASMGGASVASEGSLRDSVIKLTVRVHGRTFTIPCGDGSQDIKWLASVAAKRYELSQRVGGRSRAREANRASTGTYRPCSVRRKPLSVRRPQGNKAQFPSYRLKSFHGMALLFAVVCWRSGTQCAKV